MDKPVTDQEIANHVYKNGDALTSFDDFREYLSGKVNLGKKLGMDEEQLANSAQKVAAYLADKQSPKNSDEHLLQNFGKWIPRKSSISWLTCLYDWSRINAKVVFIRLFSQ